MSSPMISAEVFESGLEAMGQAFEFMAVPVGGKLPDPTCTAEPPRIFAPSVQFKTASANALSESLKADILRRDFGI